MGCVLELTTSVVGGNEIDGGVVGYALALAGAAVDGNETGGSVATGSLVGALVGCPLDGATEDGSAVG